MQHNHRFAVSLCVRCCSFVLPHYCPHILCMYMCMFLSSSFVLVQMRLCGLGMLFHKPLHDALVA